MKELSKKIQKISLDNAKNLILLDTCFIIHNLSNHKHFELLKGKDVAITSFNLEELLYVERKLGHELKKLIRKFLKETNFKILELPIHPGRYKDEREFVKMVDKDLLKKVGDPSDAVLIAAAIKTDSIVLTKDKHHMFTVQLEEFLKKYNLKVYKDAKFLSDH
ncbi:MAG: PIN domain-containing protein [Nanoarchaeota archaeon]|nr:PIN domain-containing protein [Nanoarchaeota archaeon]MCG2718776.1 PIN domain-containing protein [Nanoarchaeota archaeon]